MLVLSITQDENPGGSHPLFSGGQARCFFYNKRWNQNGSFFAVPSTGSYTTPGCTGEASASLGPFYVIAKGGLYVHLIEICNLKLLILKMHDTGGLVSSKFELSKPIYGPKYLLHYLLIELQLSLAAFS